MRIFTCPACGAPAPFDTLACQCGTRLVYDDAAVRLRDDGEPCANRPQNDCNWIAPAPGALCRSCAMTAVVPDTFHADNRALWAEAERAKRWVLANLANWGWFTASDPDPPPVFHLLTESGATPELPVVMGHKDGVVTINVTEADPAERTARRIMLGERLRTMIGHFRHELAHVLFARLSARPGFTQEFRALFGNETQDYAAALAQHYRAGPPPGWQAAHVTSYAASHPHEDWAETAAHVLHLTDITDSALAAGLALPGGPDTDCDPYAFTDAAALIALGAEYGLALNHVNRAMGLPDLYPFVLTPVIREKLAFAHRWISAPR